MAVAKSKSTVPDKPWNKEFTLDACRGELADYEREAVICQRRAQIPATVQTGIRWGMKMPDQWQAEADAWNTKAANVRKEISVIEAVPGEWFGPADMEVPVTCIVAIAPSGHVVSSQKSDDGRRDAAFSKRFLSKKDHAIKLMPEREAKLLYMRYISSLRSPLRGFGAGKESVSS